MESLQEIKAEYAELEAQLAALAKEGEQRSFTQDEITKFDEIENRMKDYKLKEESLTRVERFKGSTPNENRSEFKREIIHTTKRGKKYFEEQRSDATAAWCLYETPGFDKHANRLRKAAEALNVNYQSRHMTIQLPKKAGRDLDLNELRDEIRSVQEVGTNNLGGYLLDQDNSLMYSITAAMKQTGGILERCRVIRTSGYQKMPHPLVDNTAGVANIVSEKGTITNVATSVGQVELNGFKFVAGDTVTWEFLTNSAIPPNEFVGTMLGERLQRTKNAKAAVGAGTTEPFGISVQAVYSNAFSSTQAYSDLVAVEKALNLAYRQKAEWFMSSTAFANIKNMLDGNDRPLWDSSLAGFANQAPSRLMGYPYNLTDDLGTHNAVLFGDPNYYIWRETDTVEFLRDPYSLSANGQVSFITWQWADGVLADPSQQVGTASHPMLFIAPNGSTKF